MQSNPNTSHLLFLQNLIIEKLKELHESIRVFYVGLHCLQILVQDLPQKPLGSDVGYHLYLYFDFLKCISFIPHQVRDSQCLVKQCWARIDYSQLEIITLESIAFSSPLFSQFRMLLKVKMKIMLSQAYFDRIYQNLTSLRPLLFCIVPT